MHTYHGLHKLNGFRQLISKVYNLIHGLNQAVVIDSKISTCFFNRTFLFNIVFQARLFGFLWREGFRSLSPLPSENNVTVDLGQRDLSHTWTFIKNNPCSKFGYHSLIHHSNMPSEILYMFVNRVLLRYKNVPDLFVVLTFSSENSQMCLEIVKLWAAEET